VCNNPLKREDFCMKFSIDSAERLGQLVRAARKAQKIRQDDAAGSMGVSENFLGKVERGSESVQWGKLFQVLSGLGVRLEADVPDSVGAYVARTSSSRKTKAKS
jgi:transcriptional regulator with XRE-family HTH domain